MQFIEDGLCREFTNQFYSDKTERKSAALPSQDPRCIIELYNDVLRFLAEVISSEQLYNLSWPVAEFSGPTADGILAHTEWNSGSHLAWLKNAVLSFQLPLMDLPPLHGTNVMQLKIINWLLISVYDCNNIFIFFVPQLHGLRSVT